MERLAALDSTPGPTARKTRGRKGRGSRKEEGERREGGGRRQDEQEGEEEGKRTGRR